MFIATGPSEHHQRAKCRVPSPGIPVLLHNETCLAKAGAMSERHNDLARGDIMECAGRALSGDGALAWFVRCCGPPAGCSRAIAPGWVGAGQPWRADWPAQGRRSELRYGRKASPHPARAARTRERSCSEPRLERGPHHPSQAPAARSGSSCDRDQRPPPKPSMCK